jgi:hypothetical protein
MRGHSRTLVKRPAFPWHGAVTDMERQFTTRRVCRLRAALHERFDEGRRDLRDDGVAVSAQASHSGGNPMSQQTKAGFNAPRAAVGANDPPGSCPRAWWGNVVPRVSAMRAARPASDRFSERQSRAVGVAHIATACPDSFGSPRELTLPFFRSIASSATGVCQRSSAILRIATSPAELPASLFPSFARARLVGVGHKPQSFPTMWRTDATSRDNGTPAGISCRLQISAHSGEPLSPKRARNLLSKDDCRAALGDEVVKSGPEVSFVEIALSLSSDRKRLTGT